MTKLAPPTTETELMQRAEALVGRTLDELAQQVQLMAPEVSTFGKGWSGQLLELLLGASAGSLAEPDFQHLGVELKTLPIDFTGKPLESTYISIVPLTQFMQLQWHASEVYHKLKRILWVPLITHKGQALGQRQVGTPFIWSPTSAQEAILRQDWQELMDMVAMGQLEQISAKQGQYLQIRPKGANAKSLCWGFDAEGNRIQTLPRGFYLRASFTSSILKQACLV
jgi:DNA mismatch repair protein MutH